MQMIIHVRPLSEPTYFPGTSGAVKTSSLELQLQFTGKYTCLSPLTGLPTVLPANLNALVTFLNVCNFEIVHWPAVQHAYWQPSNLTWASRFSPVKYHLQIHIFGLAKTLKG